MISADTNVAHELIAGC